MSKAERFVSPDDEPVNPVIEDKPFSGGRGGLLNFNPDPDLDLRPPPPTPEEAAKNGGRAVVNAILREMAWDSYWSEYLLTAHWQNVRQMAFTVYGRRCTYGVECAGCLDVHHHNYDHMGAERPEDVEVLCRKHHKVKHDRERAFMRAQGSAHFGRIP